MSSNPLLDAHLALNPGGEKITSSQFASFIETELGKAANYRNFDPNTGNILPSHKVTVLYTGFTDGVYNGNIAKDLAARGGTDDFSSLSISNDVVRAWVTGAGIWQTDQVRMAAEFYQAVTGTTGSDPRTGSATLAGHSLGGGN